MHAFVLVKIEKKIITVAESCFDKQRMDVAICELSCEPSSNFVGQFGGFETVDIDRSINRVLCDC